MSVFKLLAAEVLPPLLLSAAAAGIPPGRLRETERISSAGERALKITGELLARYLAAGNGGSALIDIEIVRDDAGKPRCPGIKDFHFSVSHSGVYALCAAGPSPCGADIEFMRPESLDAAPAALSGGEMRIFKALPPGEKITFFYESWTLKESFLKAAGTGLMISPESFSVSGGGGAVRADHPRLKNLNARLVPFHPDYRTAVCAAVPPEELPSGVTVITAETLLAAASGGAAGNF
jgi:4'-phosphopantetheinyl transferase